MKVFNFFGSKPLTALFAIPIFSLLAFAPFSVDKTNDLPFDCSYQMSYDVETVTTVMTEDPADLERLTDMELLAIGSITEDQRVTLCLDAEGKMDLTIQKRGKSNSTFQYPEPDFDDEIKEIKVTRDGRIKLIGEKGKNLSDEKIDSKEESNFAQQFSEEFTASSEERAEQFQNFLNMATASGGSVAVNGNRTTVKQVSGKTTQTTIFNNQSNVPVYTSVKTGGVMVNNGYFNYNCEVSPPVLKSSTFRNYTVTPKTGTTVITSVHSNYTNVQTSDNR